MRAHVGLGLAQRVACGSVNMKLSECPLPSLHYSFPGLMGARGEKGSPIDADKVMQEFSFWVTNMGPSPAQPSFAFLSFLYSPDGVCPLSYQLFRWEGGGKAAFQIPYTTKIFSLCAPSHAPHVEALHPPYWASSLTKRTLCQHLLLWEIPAVSPPPPAPSLNGGFL